MGIERYFSEHGNDHIAILQQVHGFILDTHPGILAAIKYTVPFYTLKKGLFYFSVQKNVPILGVVQGHLLKEVHHLLDFTNRKQVGHFQLTNMTEQRYTDLFSVIAAAVEFDLKR
jgi:hypothetical protein